MGRAQAEKLLAADARVSIYRSLGECEVVWRRAVEAGACLAFQCFEWQAAFQATIGAAEGLSSTVGMLRVETSSLDGRAVASACSRWSSAG